MEEDILNYSPTVMLRGTPCILNYKFNTNDFKSASFNQIYSLLFIPEKFPSVTVPYELINCDLSIKRSKNCIGKINPDQIHEH